MLSESRSEIIGKQTRQMNLADVADAVIDWCRYFLRNWWVLILTAIVFGTVGVLLAYYEKPQYESKLSFALEDKGGGGLSGALSLAADFGLNISSGNDIFSGENINKIFISQRIIEDVLLSADTLNEKPLSFADEYMEVTEYKKGLLKNPRLKNVSFPIGFPRDKFSYQQDSVLYALYSVIVEKKLSVKKPDKKADIYEVKFQSPNERFTKVFTEKLVDKTIAFYTELRSKRAKNTLEVLEQRVAMMKGTVNTSISDRLVVQDANVNPAFAAAQAPVQKKEVDIKVYGAAYAELFKNLEIARIQYLKDIPLLQIIDSPHYPMKKIKKGRLMTGLLYASIATFFMVVFLFFRRIIRQQRPASKLRYSHSGTTITL